jgi:GTP cyclohydrolase II
MASTARQIARVQLPTRFGEFDARGFECDSGFVYLALCRGELSNAERVLTRLHSECLTGDALGSVRCDCGVQLHTALQAVAAEDHGVVIYATGQEGRGIGLVNKLRAYVEQDRGADTVDANLRLGLPVDSRRYTEAADVLRALGVRSIRLLTNNPAKVDGLRRAGIDVDDVRPIPVASHARSVDYLQAKELRLGHLQPRGQLLSALDTAPPDVTELLGPVTAPPDRPFVVLKYAQTLDGRIATATGDSKWISGEQERCVSHALRAACDAVLVGVETVVKDDPRMTVRMVPGSSPLRIVVDSTLRIPAAANILDGEASTTVLTTDRSEPAARQALRARNVAVHVLPEGPGGVDLTSALFALRNLGVRSLLVEGGAKVITSLLLAELVDRLVVSVSATIIGQGTEAVGDLGIGRVADGIRLTRRRVYATAEDIVVAGDVVSSQPGARDGSAAATITSVATL